jgi:hypothetical protein
MILADAAVELTGGQLVVIPLLIGLVAFLGMVVRQQRARHAFDHRDHGQDG